MTDGLIARTVLLRGVPLFGDLLTLHVSLLAKKAVLRHVPAGESFCQTGEAYLLVSGRVHKHGRPDRVYRRGDLLQQLGCIDNTLRPLKLVAGGAAATPISAAKAASLGGSGLLASGGGVTGAGSFDSAKDGAKRNGGVSRTASGVSRTASGEAYGGENSGALLLVITHAAV